MTAGHSQGLEVQDLTVRYGGHIAVDHLSLHAPLARLTGLIGPNGAGKTTTFGAISGLIRPAAGSIRFCGADLARTPSSTRAQLGLGRTFQRPELCPSLTVRQNIALAPESRAAGKNPWRQIVPRRTDRAAVDGAVDKAIELCSLQHLADRQVASLSVGQRRLVELARAQAGSYQLLLLDEPSSGLDSTETESFGRVIRALVDDDGIGILLVEHDMGLVMNVCDHLYTLDFGKLIFDGTTAETQASPAVRAAYLGTDVNDAAAVT